MMKTYHCVVGMQKTSALMWAPAPVVAPANHLPCFVCAVPLAVWEPAASSGLLAL